MKQFKHLGAYGLIIKDEKIVLIKKVGGPYNGKLDLPGGTIEWGETPEQTLIRELNEEVGIDVIKYELFDANSIIFEWIHKEELERGHHLGIFYKVLDYNLTEAYIDFEEAKISNLKVYDYTVRHCLLRDMINKYISKNYGEIETT